VRCSFLHLHPRTMTARRRCCGHCHSRRSSSCCPTTAQAVVIHPYTAVNVKTHIPVTLEMKNPNFTKWASFF
jgi:hypothetical protein